MAYRTNVILDGTDSINAHAVAILLRQCIETVDLQDHVNHARESIDCSGAPNIGLLLDGLSCELNACLGLLQKRIALLSPVAVRRPLPDLEPHPYWRLYRADGSDCPSHLEALLSGYVHYARATGDSIESLERIGCQKIAAALRRVAAAADNGLWFIELYMEGLALHVDTRSLPDFAPAAEILEPSSTMAHAR